MSKHELDDDGYGLDLSYITLRDIFAGMNAAAILSSPTAMNNVREISNDEPALVAAIATMQADALLTQLAKQRGRGEA